MELDLDYFSSHLNQFHTGVITLTLMELLLTYISVGEQNQTPSAVPQNAKAIFGKHAPLTFTF